MKTILWILLACLVAAVVLSIRQTRDAHRHLALAQTTQRELQDAMVRLREAEQRSLAAEQTASDLARDLQEISRKLSAMSAPTDSPVRSPAAVIPANPPSPTSQPTVGKVGFQAAPRPSADELEKRREERLLRRIEQVDRTYEPFYEQLGLSTPEQQRSFLMLKARQAEAETAAIQQIVNTQFADRERMSQTIRETRERIRSQLMENIRTTFGDEVAKAVHLFETSREAAFDQIGAPAPSTSFGNE